MSPKKIVNFLLVSISRFLKTKDCLGLPFNINIEPTGSCNYECVKCERFSDSYRDEGQIVQGKHMPFEHYCKIIEDIGDFLLSVRLWNFGEPLLHKDIFRMISYAKKKNIIVAVSSNLSLLSAAGAEGLVSCGLDYLIVSFDGGSARTYSLYHGADYFEKVAENIKALVYAKKKLKSLTPFIELQFIVMRENEGELAQVKRLSEELGVNKVTFLRVDKEKINFRKFNLLNRDDILPENWDYVLDKDSIRLINRCNNPWEGTLIRYSGLVLPCVEDIGETHPMGRVFYEGRYLGFKQIWKSENYRNFRAEIKDRINDIKICRNCAQRDNNIEDQIFLC
ncbi:MAG: radical SAM protein [Candidatus Omnitrophica bacterium]|nr:radical SAM protein [Candidatus Omnitrophota bacterium]